MTRHKIDGVVHGMVTLSVWQNAWTLCGIRVRMGSLPCSDDIDCMTCRVDETLIDPQGGDPPK